MTKSEIMSAIDSRQKWTVERLQMFGEDERGRALAVCDGAAGTIRATNFDDKSFLRDELVMLAGLAIGWLEMIVEGR